MTLVHKGESRVGAGLTRNQINTDRLDSAKEPSSTHALRVIEGEHQAHEYLARLRAEQADPDELTLIASTLSDSTLRGFCRVLAKALEAHHG